MPAIFRETVQPIARGSVGSRIDVEAFASEQGQLPESSTKFPDLSGEKVWELCCLGRSAIQLDYVERPRVADAFVPREEADRD